MRFLRFVVVLGALLVLAACSRALPTGVDVSVCIVWVDEANPAPAGAVGFVVSVDGVDALVELVVGACAVLGPFVSGTDVTITENVPDDLVVVAIGRTPRGSGAEQVIAHPVTPSTTFRVDDFEEIVFRNAVLESPASPTGVEVSVCNVWVDEANPAPAGAVGFVVSVDGEDALVELVVGACADLGPYASGTDVTITENVPDDLVVVAIGRTSRGQGAEQVIAHPVTPSTTFLVDDFEEIVFSNAVRVESTVVVSSITSSNSGLRVDRAAVAGVIDVTLTVVPGNDGLRRLEAFVNDELVYERAVTPAALMAMAEAAGGAAFDVLFSVATNAYTVENGVAKVAFPNGAYTLWVQVETAAGGAAGAAQAPTDLTFANADIVLLAVDAGASARDAAGLQWLGQGVTATFTHVAFSGGVATDFNASFAGVDRTTNPAVWTAADLLGVNSSASGSNLTVNTVVGGNPGPSTSRLLRYDGVAPAVGSIAGLADDFRLTQQIADGRTRCCSGNWVNPGYPFAAGSPSATDVLGGVAGVGGLTITYHAGAASLTNAQLAALPAAATPDEAGLAPSAANTAYSVVARVADALGNFTVQRLVGFGVNPATTFGLDATPPTGQAVAAGSLADRTIYNANVPGFGPFVARTIGLTAADDVSGFGTSPVALSFRYANAADGVTCLVGATAACVPTQQASTFATDNTAIYPGAGAVTEAYYQFRGEVFDRAGLGSGTTNVVTYLFDQTRPHVDDIAGVAGSFLPGQNYTFSANATDNVDLKQSEFAFVFPGLTGTNLDAIPMAAPQSLGTPWAFESPTWSAPVVASVPFVTGIEPTDGAGAPSGVLVPVGFARFVVWDVAGNQSLQQNAIAVGSFPAPVSFGAGVAPLFPVGATFRQTTQAATLCFDADAACAAPAVRAVTLTATATGASGTFQNPFAFVLFAYVDNINVGGGQRTHRFIGVDGAATVQDDGVTRTWTWSVTLTSEDLVLDAAGMPFVLPVQAIGVNTGTGTALLAVTGVAITVIDN